MNKDSLHTRDTTGFLFKRFKKGDEKAFEFYYNDLYPAILGFCNQFIYDEEQANHIVQEAFINLWLNREKIDTPGGIRAFLYTAAKSKCLNFLKHKKVVKRYRDQHLVEQELELHREVLNAMQFDPVTLMEMEDIINEVISGLPERTKDIFTMKRFQSKKNLEIAQELDISVKTVEAHFSRAISTLREQLKNHFPQVLIAILIQQF